jgi:hypothetical protein
MSMRKSSQWVVLLAVACNGQITVDPGRGGAGGLAGNDTVAGGAGVGSGGAGAGGRMPQGGDAGKAPLEMPAGMAGMGDGGNGFAGVGHSEGGYGGYVPHTNGGYGGDIIWAGYGPVGGGGANQVSPGSLGQNCIPGALVTEADGSPAKAVIQTLTRCNDGLACDAENKCVPVPDCPQSGLCVLRRAEVGGNGGSGGTGGASNMGVAGSFNWSGYGGDGSVLPPIAAAEVGVVAMTGSESHVYWIEYGTRNALGTYQHDGTVMSYDTALGTTKTIASGLEGPIGLGLTTTHAYIYVDGGRLIGTRTIPQLLRVPLAGGTAELVQDGTLFGITGAGERKRRPDFGAVGSQAFWLKGTEIYSMTSEANAVPTVVESVPDTVERDLAGLVEHDDGIFGLEAVDGGALLSRAPKNGGEFERVRALGAGYPSWLQGAGDRYFLRTLLQGVLGSDGQYRSETQVLTAGFVSTDPPIRLLHRRSLGTVLDGLWVGTNDTLYWSEGRAIYKQPLPTP